tara:strand:+ start:1662 stop:2270 length:609 start_codon:yes stop_codon:yes gene_type:complete
MKLELFIIGVTLFFIINTYLDGKLFQYMKQWKKYYQIALYGFIGLCAYLMLKKNPHQMRNICQNANQYVKMMPIDRNTQNVLMPIIDFTKSNLDNLQQQNTNLSDPNNNRLNNYQNLTSNQRRVLMSGNQKGGKTKRSVSETKKKYVASQQGWRCKHCSIQLPAWFEVDHVVKLEYGGSNSIENLEALCRDCHGKKTAMENL